ncbi:hypothetical protein SEA_SONALI_60 [Arthrobacter phage Sonali]|uniref:Uncharacterized protein n=1 Tax=Arthrobacter phage Sonali TaxID=2510495 RepID=A0A411CQR2_9CAUD|nr:hypothetical protein HOV09_gp60 [Arthrobacter phage Sonali]QAY16172.1 hypothetical protein SEA_SONALI_60 [Arthrobacter phage Sonali]
MPAAPSIETLPAQYDEGILIAHPAAVLHFLDTDVMVQRSALDGKVLVTVDGDDRATRIDLNDGTVWDGPGNPTDLTMAEGRLSVEQARELHALLLGAHRDIERGKPSPYLLERALDYTARLIPAEERQA